MVSRKRQCLPDVKSDGGGIRMVEAREGLAYVQRMAAPCKYSSIKANSGQTVTTKKALGEVGKEPEWTGDKIWKT